MVDIAKEIRPVNIEDELKQSYLDYAMSVIVGRALPDVRDGLKPVHRRVLFAMNQLGNDWNKAYKKSARVVGDVIGKYHPHGDSAVYDTIVRMAQPFAMRYMLVDGQGNFGSIDGDNAAAMRYTEVRMAKISHELLADLEKETVDFVDNYDGSERMPSVMPTRVPTLLVNGSSGIAVGMATNIPPHNLTEVINGCLALLDNPELTIDDLMKHVTGPDFPTAALINGRAGILQAYRTGRGRIYMRSRASIEVDEKTNRETIIVHEIPYQVNKARMIEKIAELVKEKRIEGISEIRDESDKDGLRVVIELRRGEVGEVVLNNLYQQTQLEVVFGINMVALVDGQPRTLNLKAILECFLAHRREVVTRRTIFLLRKAKERGHLLEGLAVALANIDPVIAMIKGSASTAEAREKLLAQGWAPGHVKEMLARAGGESACRPEDLGLEFGFRDDVYYLSLAQAQAILDLRLQKLTGLEHEKLIEEYQTRLDEIMDLGQILANPERMLSVIREELSEIKETYGDDRRTEIVATRQDLTVEDLIQEETMVLTISNGGYAKTQPLSDYRAQRRGGRGRSATSVKEADYVEHLLVASTHDMVMCFTNHGKVYWLKIFQFPQASRGARGRPVVNVLPLGDSEKITSILPMKEPTDNGFILMTTSKGTVKKVAFEQFSRPRSSGLIAIELEEGDTLVGTSFTSGENNVMLLTSEGKGIRFNESGIRPMGRTARGVRGIRLSEGHRVISLLIEHEGGQVLTASANGYGKRTPIDDFPVQGRGGQGVIAMVCNERNGEMVGAVQVSDTDEMMLISDQGTLVRTRVEEVSSLGRNTQGVVLIRLGGDEHLVGIERVDAIESDENDEPDDTDGDAALVNDEGAAAADDASSGNDDSD
jgi:DNA gyrase subunit A